MSADGPLDRFRRWFRRVFGGPALVVDVPGPGPVADTGVPADAPAAEALRADSLVTAATASERPGSDHTTLGEHRASDAEHLPPRRYRAHVDPAATDDLRDHPDRYFNRELSWLDFNARVLALAGSESMPLLERAKFLSIFSSNLDEFFQVRVAGLKDQVYAGVETTASDGRTAVEQLREIRVDVVDLVHEQERLLLEEIVPALASEGVTFRSWEQLDTDARTSLTAIFHEHIFPVLTPLAVDPGHPFPYISNLSLSLAIRVADPESGEDRFARVKIPSNLARFVQLPDEHTFVPLEQVIAAHLDELFPGMEIGEVAAFRVTRNADLTLEENEADDLLAAVEVELRRRRFGRAVRLEIGHTMSAELRELLIRELDITDDDVYPIAAPLDLTGLRTILALDRSDLKDPHWHGIAPARLVNDDESPADFFAEMRRNDVLVHHPYASFRNTVEAFLRQAVNDRRVVAIKMTLYRTSGDSSIIRSLIRAAEQGKQVAVLVELKARFDEAANIEWAKALEEVGVHVVYGLVGLKTHTKTLLVVREERDGLRRYCHIGTGNYNPKTATIYEDLGLFTCDPAIGTELSQLFNHLTGFGRAVDYERLVVAPDHLRDTFERMIADEAARGSEGRIIAKMNSLSDPQMIDALYDASRAGVQIDLIIRGICCLRPGVPGLSDNIRVRSIVGRYLEHSRIYYFGNALGPGEPSYLIGSADLMTRNINRRVEALVPIDDQPLRDRLQEIIDISLADDQLAWELDGDGRWSRAEGGDGVNAHLALQQAALGRARVLDFDD
ncbi:polyphosphate kinase 1 [Actinospongicola halichondriae]|uniref:polyphosphate kinase 1 n=1 Tax=Actinospongicola halichondriae TaxID=3236844 RepID=UPI003D5B11E1